MTTNGAVRREAPVFARDRTSQWPAISMSEATALVESQNNIRGIRKSAYVGAVKIGSVLAEDIYALRDIPRVRTSIVDGYAVLVSDGVGRRTVIGTSTAGLPFAGVVVPGCCVRISTGANVPEGTTGVVKVEDTTLSEHDDIEERAIIINVALKEGDYIRRPGVDMQANQLLLQKGQVIGSQEIGVLAASGARVVNTFRKPRVCVMSTGNELVDCSVEELQDGQVSDTNRPQLMKLFQSYGLKPIDAGIAADTRHQLVDAIKVAFRFANVLVTSGGVSMGEKDLLKSVLQDEFGFKIHFGRVFMKPGLPSTFATGVYNNQEMAVFALPGNPVSSWVSAQLFAIPFLLKCAGRRISDHFRMKVKLGLALTLDPRPEFARAYLTYMEGGAVVAVTTGNQLSSRIPSLTNASLLLELPGKTEECPVLDVGTEVDALVVGHL